MGHKQSKLSPKELADLRSQTQLSEADFQEYYKEFLQRHPKGIMTKDEVINEYKTVFPDGDPVPFAKHLFKVYDQNKDGTIDFREFICGMGLMSRGNMNDKLRTAFRTYDLDNNGYISRKEMQSVLTAIYKTIAFNDKKRDEEISTFTANAVFKSMDKNRDNKVSFEEFVAGVNEDPDVVQLLETLSNKIS